MTKEETTKKEIKEEEISIEEDFELSEVEGDDAQDQKTDRYYEAVGRRKSSTARVRIYTKGAGILINEKNVNDYFTLAELQESVSAPLKKMKSLDRFRVSAIVTGGGIRGQAEAVRHAISRALVVFNADFKKRLKRAGYLKRDPRAKERKKYGLKKARKAPRWAKR